MIHLTDLSSCCIIIRQYYGLTNLTQSHRLHDCFILRHSADGGPARVVCELAGIKNIRTKSLGSNNKQNVVLATISGLSQIKAPEEVAKNRGKSVEEVLA